MRGSRFQSGNGSEPAAVQGEDGSPVAADTKLHPQGRAATHT